MFERKPTFNREKQMKHFENHVATLQDYGDIKVLDFKNPESINYRIRFIFEEDWCRCHISGDLGELVATNYNNMTYEGFKDFVHNTGYFKGKINCASRDIYEYDYELAVKELNERLEDVEFDSFLDETQEELRKEKIEEIMDDFGDRRGLGSKAYELLSEYDQDCFEYFDSIGRKDTEILELYMLAFELATEQLNSKEADNKTKVETRASIMAELGISRIEDPKILNEPLSPEVAEAFRNIMTATFEQYWKEDDLGNLK